MSRHHSSRPAIFVALPALALALSGCFSAHPFLEDTGNIKILENIEAPACPFCQKKPNFRSTIRYATDTLQPHEYFDVYHYCPATDSVFHPHFWYYNSNDAFKKWEDHCSKIGGSK